MENFYIYRHIRLDTNTPFYVGKGCKGRAYSLKYRNKLHKNISQKHNVRVEIILSGLSEEKAFSKEMEFIKLYKSIGYCEANFTIGGEGASGYRYTEEQKIAHSKRNQGSKNPAYRMGYRQIGLKNPMYGRCGNKNPMFGKKRPECSKKIQILNKINNPAKRPDFKLKVSPKISGENSYKAKKVVDLNSGFVWSSITEASKIYNYKYHTLKSWLNGTNKNKTSLKLID